MKRIKLLISNPVISGSAVLVGGSMVANIVNYVYHFAMGRALGPSGYGVLASLYSMLYVLSIIPSSTSVAVVKFVSAAKTETDQAVVYQGIKKLIIRLGIIGALIVALLSPLIAGFLHIDQILSVLMLAPVFVLGLFMLLNQSTSQGQLNFIGNVMPNILMSIVKFLLGFALVLIGLSVDGAMIGVVMGVIIGYLVSKKYVYSLDTKKVKANFEIRKFFKFSAPVLLQALAFTSLMSVDVLLVKHFFPDFEAGLYAALSTLGKIIFFAAQPVTGAMFPIVSKRSTHGQSYAKVFWGGLLLTLLISFGALISYGLFPNIAIGVLYGKSYLSAAPLLIWMGGFYTVYTLASFLTNYYLSLGKTSISYLALLVAFAQIGLIIFIHSSLLVVIQISFFAVLVQTILLLGIFLYNHHKK